jgi:hypothetical protein
MTSPSSQYRALSVVYDTHQDKIEDVVDHGSLALFIRSLGAILRSETQSEMQN